MVVTHAGAVWTGSRDAGLLITRVEEFSRFLIRADRSPATVKTYATWALGDFVDFLLSRRIQNLEDLQRQTLEAWQDRLLACKLKPRSRSLATTGVRQFLKWAADHDYCDPRLKDWLTTVHVAPLKPKPLAPAALAKLVSHYGAAGAVGQPEQPKRLVWLRNAVGQPEQPKRLVWLRNRAMFFYFVSTGARVSEALQVPREGCERVTVRQKGGTEKLLTIPDSVRAVVLDYLAVRRDRAPLLFVSHPGERPMTPGGVRHVWHKVADQLGIARFSSHQLRHTFATELLERGVDPVTVAELLGHHGMQTIRNYAQVRGESRARAMRAIEDALHPPSWRIDPHRTSGPADGPTVESASSSTDVMTVPPADPRSLPQLSGRRGRPKFLLTWAQAISHAVVKPGIR